MNHHYLLHSSFYLLLLTGCATEPAQRQIYINEAVQAKSFMQSGQHKLAADLYQKLAKSKPAHSNQLNILAAEAFIKSGDSHAALSHVNAINPTALSAEQRNKLNLLYAQISLSNGEAEQALDKLGITQPYQLKPTDQVIFYQSLAFAHSLTGNLLQSVETRIKLNSLLDNAQQRYENNSVIINTLNLLPSQTLILDQPAAPDILGGWMALTRILKSRKFKQDSPEFQTRLNEWRQLFPQHPAHSDYIQSYRSGSKHNFKRPTAIAILLPESGRFAKAAQIIKEGVMASYNHPNSGYQPPIRFYDSATGSPVNLYHQAISEGAELIIGPLRKENIQNLALSTELTIPVLALNHISNLAKNNLFQFGLSPIDEVIQITNKASQDGHKKALLLSSESNKGERIANHLIEYWQTANGTLLEAQSYNKKGNDFSQPIKKLLNLDESRYRYNKLKRFLATNIHYTERRRQDVDAIFLFANPQKARSIYPQLRFYRATNIPVYATARIYSGLPNPSLDIDLNNVTFCDIPWLFPDIYQSELSQMSLRNIWQQFPNKHLRLVALGIDSFNIITHLDQLNISPYSGATGTLSLNQENRITRQLVCAKFIDGKPVLQDFSIEANEQLPNDRDFIYSEDLVQ